MGGKKFEISRLVNIRKKIEANYTNVYSKFSCQVCLDWDEFNKLYFSKRNSVVQGLGTTSAGISTISIYVAMKMAFDMKKVHIVTKYSSFISQFNEFYNVIVPNKNITGWKGRLDSCSYTSSHPQFDTICNCDEIVMISDEYTSASQELDFIDALLMELARPEHRNVKFTILTHDNDHIDSESLHTVLKERFPEFLFFDYTKEKEFVDNWFDKNDTLIDPEFDIKVLDPTLDKKQIWRYIATNHKYKFREYCKMDREFVTKDMPMKELKDYGIF